MYYVVVLLRTSCMFACKQENIFQLTQWWLFVLLSTARENIVDHFHGSSAILRKSQIFFVTFKTKSYKIASHLLFACSYVCIKLCESY